MNIKQQLKNETQSYQYITIKKDTSIKNNEAHETVRISCTHFTSVLSTTASEIT